MSTKGMKVDTIIMLDENVATIQKINGRADVKRCDQLNIAKNVPYINIGETLYFPERIWQTTTRKGRKHIIKIQKYYAKQPRKQ